ncbi:arginine--tRNA ligase [Anaerostipes sp. MSJ-23]|uniref:arginine--tRNA ligase n=1 Tax=Anaerostipes sp. MSJ-23 TaxID=2841520 RepID=UPI001C10A724|nr:arginine--tRNA ligase [Anaerostipes sp. MSJ-23]MBU5460732.1 arginine--tRNA ligase [Anaerostipes sp. MSJ-23]
MKNKIIDLLDQTIEELDKEKIADILEIPPKEDMGDFAFPCFQLAKVFRKAPNMIAQEIAEKIPQSENLSKVAAMGPYVNFYVNKEIYVKEVLNKIGSDYGASDEGNGKTICIDYSSPNVAKNFHVGHLRTTIIGNSLYHIFDKLGYKVERINHLGDWGTQFGKLIVAYKKWGSKEAVEEKGIPELLELYVRFHKEAEKDDSLNDQAREWFVKMEQGDKEALEIWEWFKDISLIEYKRIYKILNVDFDHYTGESFYRDKTAAVVQELKEKGLLEESEGAKIVNLEKYDMAPCLVTKKDGSSIYATRDLAAIFYRKNTYHFDKCIYVTGLEQKLHFAQVFKVVELMGYEWAKDQLIHVPYGLVSLEGGKLSTRNGNIIYAEDILKESVSKIREIIAEKNPDLKDKEDVAQKVGIGAIIFNDLYNQRIKDVTFTWEKIHSFDGETGPYVQYTYARAASVLRKTGISEVGEIDASLITDDTSVALLKEIERFPEVVKTAAQRLEPSVVSRYVMAVAQAFNRFYHENQCNVEDENLMKARVKLVLIAKQVIKDALDLLGIQCPEQM